MSIKIQLHILKRALFSTAAKIFRPSGNTDLQGGAEWNYNRPPGNTDLQKWRWMALQPCRLVGRQLPGMKSDNWWQNEDFAPENLLYTLLCIVSMMDK
jgi:hypothetical protein